MKIIKINKGLNLNKKSITKLQESQLLTFKGGGVNDLKNPPSCVMHSCIGRL